MGFLDINRCVICDVMKFHDLKEFEGIRICNECKNTILNFRYLKDVKRRKE